MKYQIARWISVALLLAAEACSAHGGGGIVIFPVDGDTPGDAVAPPDDAPPPPVDVPTGGDVLPPVDVPPGVDVPPTDRGGSFCGDRMCDRGETCTNCPSDCGACTPFCGDGACNNGETCATCPTDCRAGCGAVCGDGACTGGETCASCPVDCHTGCAPVCGDGACTGSETCASCPTDCHTGCADVCATAGATCGGCEALGASGCGWCSNANRCVSGSSAGPTSFVSGCSLSAGTWSVATPARCTVSPGGYTRSAGSAAFIDACAAGGHVTILPSVDDSTTTVPLSFSFQYWGTLVPTGTSVVVSPNGALGLGGTGAISTTGILPSTSPSGVIAPYWVDLYTRPTGVCVATVGTPPNLQFVVEWNDAYYYNAGTHTGDVTVEAILSQGTNTIDFVYGPVSAHPVAYTPTVGIENQAGTQAVIVCNTGADGGICPAGASGTSIRFTPTS